MNKHNRHDKAPDGLNGEGANHEPELTQEDGTLYEREFWGISRHEAVAGAAEPFLSANARANVERILESVNQVLADTGGWADKVKNRRPRSTDDPDTVAFLEDARNRGNGPWHYVNLPLNAEEYSREKYPTFTRDDDVVQIIGESVRVLLGDSDRFSELNALRLLTHLVGDVHQPVHVGCCYIDKTGSKPKLVRNPKVALDKDLPSDRGGNSLLLPVTNAGVSLHTYWDSRLGGGADDDHNHAPQDDELDTGMEADEPLEEHLDPVLRERFIRKLSNMVRVKMAQQEGDSQADDPDPPPLDQWAVQWASSSLVTARSAYRSLKIKGQRGNTNQFDVTWPGKETYDARCIPIVKKRLTLATQNLAALLNAIWP